MQGISARLILKDNTTRKGILFGSPKTTSGEVVFATGMVGYPEALTDPSFAGQIVVFTYPLIGNYGVPGTPLRTRSSKWEQSTLVNSFESHKIWAAGVVVQNYYDDTDHATASLSFSEWLKMHDVPGIAGIDTRALTKKLREEGSVLGQISLGTPASKWDDPNAYNIVKEVSCKKSWTAGSGSKRVILIDCGTKMNIIRELAKRDCIVNVVPWDTDVRNYEYDGVFISNGPGDPTKCKETIKNIRAVLSGDKPIFGVCLGNQLLALAAGAQTRKLPYGHRAQNQPCTDLNTDRCYITTQNHGFHVVGSSLPAGWKEWFVNVNDGTNEGIYHTTKPFCSVQFHPEAYPGPTDTAWLFDRFVKML